MRGALGGCHRVDDRVIHHHSSDGREDVTADESTIFVKAITAIGPLLETRAVTEGLTGNGLFTLIFIFNLAVKTHPNPVVQGDSVVLKGVNHIFKAGVGAGAITELNRVHLGLQCR